MDSLPNRSGCSLSLVTRFAKNWFEILHSNRIVAFSSLIRLWSFRRFLFAVKFWSAGCRKEKADLAYFGQSKIPLVRLFSQIQLQARSISSSWTLQIPLKATTEHFFSIAAIMWHSALSLITLLLSCEQGLLIFSGQADWVNRDFGYSDLYTITAQQNTKGIKRINSIG